MRPPPPPPLYATLVCVHYAIDYIMINIKFYASGHVWTRICDIVFMYLAFDVRMVPQCLCLDSNSSLRKEKREIREGNQPQ